MFRNSDVKASHRANRTWRSALAFSVSVMMLTLGAGLPFANSLHSASASATATASKFRLKKGVSAWPFKGVTTALARSGASWYLNWSSAPDGIVAPAGVRFVPMIWGGSNVNPARLTQAKHFGPYLLTFNEPDLSGQANLTPEQALSLWPQLEATGLKLASPSVSWGANNPGGWLDQFMQGAAALNYRVDFIALHWYGADFHTGVAVSQLRTYLVSVHQVYPSLPIWLTEYALTDFSGAVPQYPSGAQQAAFVSASIRMLDSLPFLARFAWFALPTDTGPNTGLFRPGPAPTPAGQAFSRAP